MLGAILVQIYWFSFIIVGLAALVAVRHLAYKNASRYVGQLTAIHPLITLVTAGITGFIVFIPLVLLGYIFEWSIYVVAVAHILSLLLSSIVLVRHREWISWVRGWRAAGWFIPLAVGIGVVLIFDYGSSLVIGAFFTGSDDTVHVARINYMLDNKMALTDPFLGNNGVVDARYSINLLATFQAAIASLLGISALDVWSYSYGFYRLIIWLSIFTSVWILLMKVPYQRIWSYIILLLLPLVTSVYFVYALYPDRIVLAWTALYLAGLLLWLQKRNPMLMIIAALLIAVTHAMYALMALGFTLLLGVFLLLVRMMRKTDIQLFVCVLLILSVPVILNLYYPNRISESEQAFNAGVISGGAISYENYFGLLVHKIHFPFPVDVIIGAAILGLYTLVIRSVKHTRLRRFMLGCWLTAVCFFVYSPLLASLIAAGYLVYKVKDIRVRGFLVILMAYFALLVYNPIFIGLFHDKVPPWLVARFHEFNVLALVLPIIGTFVLFDVITRKIDVSLSQKFTITLSLLVVVCLPFLYNLPNQISLQQARTNPDLEAREQKVRELRVFRDQLQDSIVFSNAPEYRDPLQQVLPMTVRANVISLRVFHYSPMVSPEVRQKCQDLLEKNLAENDLAAANVDYVLAYKSTDPADHTFRELLQTQPHTSLVRSTGHYELYKVSYSDISVTANSACNIPYGQ